MPSQQEVKWSQLKVGVIVLVSLALLCTLLFLMARSSGMGVFSKKLLVDAYFQNSDGIKSGGEVQFQGVTIGEVTKVLVSIDPARRVAPVHVTMKIDPKFQGSLHKDSTASLTKVGLVGDTVVDINSQLASGPLLQDGDQLPSNEPTDIDAVMKSSKTTLDTLNTTLAKLNGIVTGLQNGEGTAGQLIKNPALYNNASETIGQLRQLATNINSGKGSVGKLMHDDELYNRLDDTANKLDTIANNLSAGKGTAGKLLNDDTLYNNLNSTVSHANSILAEADAGRGGLGLLVKDPKFAKQLDQTMTRLDKLVTGIDEGRGTLGKLATDDAAYSNLNKLLTESTTLVTMIRQDPKKYLVIHMKIF